MRFLQTCFLIKFQTIHLTSLYTQADMNLSENGYIAITRI